MYLKSLPMTRLPCACSVIARLLRCLRFPAFSKERGATNFLESWLQTTLSWKPISKKKWRWPFWETEIREGGCKWSVSLSRGNSPLWTIWKGAWTSTPPWQSISQAPTSHTLSQLPSTTAQASIPAPTYQPSGLCSRSCCISIKANKKKSLRWGSGQRLTEWSAIVFRWLVTPPDIRSMGRNTLRRSTWRHSINWKCQDPLSSASFWLCSGRRLCAALRRNTATS